MKKKITEKREKFFTLLTSEEFHEELKDYCKKKSCSMRKFIMTSIREAFVSLTMSEKEDEKKEYFLKMVDIIDKDL